MFFEGSEKKVEVVVSSDGPNLRQLGKEYWSEIVGKCRAQILSTVSNEHLDAYLLSESSLFVWEDRFLMITCGRTVLINSILEFIKEYDPELIESIIFQRKNEYESREQITSFLEDISKLRSHFSGSALRLGRLDGHFTYLFHLDQNYNPTPDDYTTELLMYHIEGEGAEILRTENQKIEVIRNLLGLETLLPNITFDDFVFEPFGYSMNGIVGDRYITMHITPQEDSSYVSFETDLDLSCYPDLIPHLVKNLSPGSFDVVTFNCKDEALFNDDYIVAGHFRENLKCGYAVNYKHMLRKDEKIRNAVRL